MRAFMCPVSFHFYFSLVKVTSRGSWPNCTFRLCHLAPRRCSESQIPCPMTQYFIQMWKWGDNLAQVGFNQEKERDSWGYLRRCRGFEPCIQPLLLKLRRTWNPVEWGGGYDSTSQFFPSSPSTGNGCILLYLKLRILIQGLNSNRVASVAPPWPPLGTHSSLILSTTLYERTRSWLRNTMDF